MHYTKAQFYKTAFYPRYNFYVKILDHDIDANDSVWFYISWRDNNGTGRNVYSCVPESELESFCL